MFLLGLLGFLILVYGIVAFIGSKVNKARTVSNAELGDKRSYGYKPLWPVLPFQIPAVLVGIFLILITSLITRVGPQEVAVITTPGGVNPEPLHTGWHLVAPWNAVHFMDKTVWVYTCANAAKEDQKNDADAIWAPTSEGIKMGFDVSVSWKIVADEAPWIYQNVTENDGGNSGRYLWLEENVIRPKLKSTMALTVSNYTPIEAYSSKRQEIQDQVFKRISEECKQYKLKVDNVDIREVYYNAEYEKAINNKKLAEQEALRLFEVTKQREEVKKQEAINKDIVILQAEGEAKSLQIKGTSISNNPRIIELEWINKWNGELPTYMMGSGQGIMLNLNK